MHSKCLMWSSRKCTFTWFVHSFFYFVIVKLPIGWHRNFSAGIYSAEQFLWTHSSVSVRTHWNCFENNNESPYSGYRRHHWYDTIALNQFARPKGKILHFYRHSWHKVNESQKWDFFCWQFHSYYSEFRKQNEKQNVECSRIFP